LLTFEIVNVVSRPILYTIHICSLFVFSRIEGQLLRV